MTHNDILRSLRYMLNIGDGALIDITRLGGGDVAKAGDVDERAVADVEHVAEAAQDVVVGHASL